MRKICLKIHRWLGLALGVIISVICLTGAVIVFQDEIKEAINADIRHVEDKGDGHYLTDEELIDAIRRHADKELTLTSIQMPSNADEPAYAQFAERGHQKLAVNPYTGELIGWEKESTVVNTAKQLHRYLLNVPSEPHEGMSAGRFIVGTTAICMTLILLTGIVIWWPHSRKMLKNRLKVSTGKGLRRFVYDSHVSLGIYGVVFLLLMSLTGPSWSFHWYRQGAMTVLGGDVRNMEHHGQFEKRQQDEPAEVSIMRSDMAQHGQDKKPPQVVLMRLHTGEWGGLLVKVIYFLAAIIGALLPWSGYYMWWKRTHPQRKPVVKVIK